MRFQRYIVSLKVTNDTAERAVHLVDQFAQTIADEDDDMQWLLQSVEDIHRKRHPDTKKGTMHKLGKGTERERIGF